MANDHIVKKANSEIVENLKWLKVINWEDDPKYGEYVEKLKIIPVSFNNKDSDATSFTDLITGKKYEYTRKHVVTCYEELKKDYDCENCFVFDYNTDLFLQELFDSPQVFTQNTLPKDEKLILELQQKRIRDLVNKFSITLSEKSLFDKNVILNIADETEKHLKSAYETDFEIRKKEIDKPNSNVNVFHYTK